MFGYSIDDDFTFMQNMLHEGQTGYEVLSLDTPWVTTVASDLLELDIDPSLIRKKWRLHVAPSGKLYTVPREPNQLLMYYRKDLFDKHGLSWPETWEQFDVTLKDLMAKEPGIWGFTLPIDRNSQNRIIYVLVSLLSGHDAGSVVEADGNITINNPNAARTLAMWKNWIGTICPQDAYGYTSNDAYNLFAEGKAAVLLHWTTSSTKLLDLMKQNTSVGWDIQIAPVPGPNGAGCSGDWSVGINRHTPLKEAALDLVKRFAENFSYYEEFAGEPVRADVMARPGFWNNMYAANPMIAVSMQTYPAFWDRLVHRPSTGCKALYDDCINIVFKHVTDFFVSSDFSAEAAVAAMESDLKQLLGDVDLHVSGYSRRQWSDTRIAMVIVSCAAGLLLIGIAVVIRHTARSMRSASNLKIPVSIMLGLVAVVSFSTVLSVVVTRNDAAIRGISKDMSASLRQQGMLALEISVTGTIDGLVEQSKVTWALLMQRVLGNIRQDIGRMRLQPRSLIVLIDRASNQVLVSNDEKLQPTGVVATDSSPDLNPWVRDALRNVNNWNTSIIDPDRSYLYSTDGGDVYANMLNIRKSASGDETSFISYSVDWLLVYMTPHEVIMGSAEAAYDEAIDLSIILASVGLVVLLACAVVITHPFVKLVKDMKLVESMEMDMIVKRDSMLLEVSALLGGFYAMCDILNEYKAYMPATLFQKSDSEPEEMDTNSRTSRSSRSVHTAPTIEGIHPVGQLRMHPSLKSITLLSIWYSGSAAADVTHILDAVSAVTSGGGRGAMLSTTGDLSIIGLNIATQIVAHIMKGAQCGMMIRERLQEHVKTDMIGIGCATGKATVASCGSMAIKAFTALGKVMQVARYVSEEACELGAGLLMENSVSNVVSGSMELLPITLFPASFKRSALEAIIYRAGGYVNAENEEWMYSYARTSSDTSALALCLSSLSAVSPKEDNRRTLENIESHWASNTDSHTLPSYLQESMRRLRARYCNE
eukprot:TRINITY_DN9677_c2_g1_i1.p1 TRINITY_DN9677_c2_g1~~TRINITY_DN9677_c2_g1_i1.p1  ORF type:complete len:1064 (+),score=379.66 TRINITY_DN9677_c2_g1_i1:231-3194(+)